MASRALEHSLVIAQSYQALSLRDIRHGLSSRFPFVSLCLSLSPFAPLMLSWTFWNPSTRSIIYRRLIWTLFFNPAKHRRLYLYLPGLF